MLGLEGIRLYLSAESGDAKAELGLIENLWFGRNGHREDRKLAREMCMRAIERGKAVGRGNKEAEDFLAAQEKELKNEFGKYLEAAQAGDNEARLQVGRCYEMGVGVEKDKKLAVKWYDFAYGLAAENKRAKVLYHLGRYHQANGEREKAVGFYRQAADQGYAAAWWDLGWCYENGVGVDRNNGEAVKCYRLGTSQGDAVSWWALGRCYEKGIGVSRDKWQAVQAMKCYSAAAKEGDAQASYDLGRCYEEGIGVKQDQKEAVKCYREAASKGNRQGQRALGRCLMRGTGTDINEEEAMGWYYFAAMQKDGWALHELGWCLKNERLRKKIGIDADATAAATLCFTRAHKLLQGYTDSEKFFAYAEGFALGLIPNERGEELAADNYNEAAELGHPVALMVSSHIKANDLGSVYFWAGRAYRQGAWVTKDDIRALEFFRCAASRKHKEAKAIVEASNSEQQKQPPSLTKT